MPVQKDKHLEEGSQAPESRHDEGLAAGGGAALGLFPCFLALDFGA